MPIRPLIDNLLLYDPNRSTTTANLWVAHPSPSEEAALGKLFMVISIDSSDRLNHEIISSLQEQIKHAYYQSTEAKFSLAFEQALHQTNQHLHRLVIEGVDGWIERLHCLIGVMVNGQLMMAHAGSMMAYVLRRNRMHDILGGQLTPINPLKIFSNVLEGQLEDQDQLLVCTPSVLDYFSLEKLRRTMSEHTPAESVRQLESSLLGSEQHIALAALIIQAEGQADTVATVTTPIRELGRPSTVAPQRSMDSLIARERATEQLLTPSVWPSIRDTVSHSWLISQRFISQNILRRPVKRTLPTGLSRTPPTSVPFSAWRGFLTRGRTAAQYIPRAILRTWQSFWLSLQRQQARRNLTTSSSAPQLPRNSGSVINRMVGWFTTLTGAQRIIFGLGVSLIFVLTATIIMTNGRANQTNTASATNVAEVNNHLDKAEAALLYGGEETALTQLQAATAALAGLPKRSKDDQAAFATITTRVETVRTKLRRVVTIVNPEILAQLAEVAPTIRPQQLYWTGDQLFSYDPSRQSGVVVNTATADEPTVIKHTLDTGNPTTGTVITNDAILFATERQGFVELQVSTASWKPIDATWPTGDHLVQSLSFFQNRVYALDRLGSEIIRFSRGTNSLGTGFRWLKETASLQGARSAVVDGSIFVLQSKGQVEEYFNGRRGDFAVAPVDPVLENPTRLVTSADSTRLYLVEPSKKRIVVFDKNGKLVRQYQSESWSSLTDIAVNEKQKTAIILNGSTLYRLPLQD